MATGTSTDLSHDLLVETVRKARIRYGVLSTTTIRSWI